jgi:methionine-rich copper-binding protein CopC
MTAVRRVVARTAAVLLLLTAVLAATPATGWAQAGGLVSAEPADGAPLTQAPRVVELTFNRVPDPALSHVGVVDGSAARLDTGDVTLSGPGTLRERIRTAAKGTVVVAYHVVFTDGTEAFGSIRFSVGTGVAPPAIAGNVQRAAEASALAHTHDIDPLSAILLVVDLGVLVGVVLLLILRPKRRTDGLRSGGEHQLTGNDVR